MNIIEPKKNKLISLPEDVFKKLSILASHESVSLKKLIEKILIEEARLTDFVLRK